MPPTRKPSLGAFLAEPETDASFAQVAILHRDAAFELRHLDDRDADAGSLRLVPLSALRDLAQFTATRAFRPLKSAPNLQSGWRCLTNSAEELESALNSLYPGAPADWRAAQAKPAPVTGYRDFTNRQTGMYRNTQKLTDPQVAEVVKAVCHPRFCLKRRLWPAPALAEDAFEDKSLIACLEPCALLLECGRATFRMEQKDKLTCPLSPDDARTIQAALRRALSHPVDTVREADFSSPDNPRRIELALNKIEKALTPDEDAAGN